MHRATETRTPSARRDWLTAVALAAVAFAVFYPALDYEFVNFDDDVYVTKNASVQGGLSARGVRYAFTSFDCSNWHPLTWLSLELDASLWRKADGTPDSSGFHQTSVLLHAANAALLFLALRALTGAYWRSAAVALLFAVHPLRAESVAWVAERKDVLSALFGLSALWAYASYVRRPSAWRYVAVAGPFTLSLLAKPMLVTLPCLFLVLDWWPLRRVESVGRWRGLVVEKLPLFALAVASCVVTYVAQSRGTAVRDLEAISPAVRAGNAVLSYVLYLGQTAWPAGLAVFYPHPGGGLSPAVAAGAAVSLAALTAGAVALRRRAPYLLTGWLWFSGTLVPVIGLVQVGDQARADRYSYFPQIGVLLAACWAAADLARQHRQAALAVGAVLAAALAVATRIHLPVWHDSVALWRHDLSVTGPAPLPLKNLGVASAERGDADTAVRCFREVVSLTPNSPQAHTDLGNQLARLNRFDEAAESFRAGCAARDDFAPAHTYLGCVLVLQGKPEEAKREHEKALRIDPEFSDAYGNLAAAELVLHELDGAVGHFRTAVRLRPNFVQAWCGLGDALLQQGRPDESLTALNEALRFDPDFKPARQLQAKARELARRARDYERGRPGAAPGTTP